MNLKSLTLLFFILFSLSCQNENVISSEDFVENHFTKEQLVTKNSNKEFSHNTQNQLFIENFKRQLIESSIITPQLGKDSKLVEIINFYTNNPHEFEILISNAPKSAQTYLTKLYHSAKNNDIKGMEELVSDNSIPYEIRNSIEYLITVEKYTNKFSSENNIVQSMNLCKKIYEESLRRINRDLTLEIAVAIALVVASGGVGTIAMGITITGLSIHAVNQRSDAFTDYKLCIEAAQINKGDCSIVVPVPTPSGFDKIYEEFFSKRRTDAEVEEFFRQHR